MDLYKMAPEPLQALNKEALRSQMASPLHHTTSEPIQ